MSTDRLERRLPEVLTELALPRVPDYVDNLLSRTERMPQRPGWTFPERWIPVSAFTDALTTRRPISLRPLIAVALLLAIVIASIVLYVGTQKRLPPLFGPAGNGLIVTSANGDIVSIDPISSGRRTLVDGDHLCCVSVSPDGQYVTYLDVPVDGDDPASLRVAGIDGKVVAEIPAEYLRGLSWGEWSAQSDRIINAASRGVMVTDVKTGKTTMLDLQVPFPIRRISWIGTSDDLLISARRDPVNGGAESVPLHVYRWAEATGAMAEIAILPYAVDPPILSPDGSKFAYFIWGPEERLKGRIHVFDLTTSVDTAITPEDEASNAVLHEVEGIAWSPDGSLIAAMWFFEGYDQLGVIPAAGGEPTFVGPKTGQGEGASDWRFSPDGQTLLVRYGKAGTALLLPVGGGEGREVSLGVTEDIDWQRLAP